MSTAPKSFMSIGEVLTALRTEFSDVTISKIRFLEAEGLIEPSRTSSGYRKFSRADLSRLRYVLQAQRDHYLPLRVIKSHLAALDRGLEPGTSDGGGPRVPMSLVATDGLPGPETFAPDPTELRLSREELLSASGLSEDQLDALSSFSLVSPVSGGTYYDGDALVIASTVAEMARFGLEARHLRPFRMAADREIGLVQQVITPLERQRNPEARARAEEAVRELAALSVKLHASLVRAALVAARGR